MTALLRTLPLLLLAACAFSDPGAPRNMRLGEARTDTRPGTCPQVAGTYRVEENVLGQVIGNKRAYESRNAPWQYLTVLQEGDSLLRFVYAAPGRADTTLLRQPGDFSCNTGWIEPRGGWERLQPVERDPNDGRSLRQEFRIASEQSGALVGQVIERRFRELTVWCGDGCRGFPIPGTGRRTVTYSRLGDSLSPPEAAAPAHRTSSPEALQERLAREAAALENGPR